MRLQIISLGFLIFFINSIAQAQKISKKDIIGEWHLIRLKLDSTVIIDINKIDEIKGKNLGILREIKPDYTKEDSLKEIEHVDKGVAEIKKIFFQFNKDNTYTNREVKGGGTITDGVENGRYELLSKKSSIRLKDSKGNQSNLGIKIKDGVLSMTVITEERTILMEFKKQLIQINKSLNTNN
ncbi:MAG TPA: hypothetical protein VNW06_05565 [Cytophagaceae bacterium]|jgi:hypothetical protein|nr:hypothetical protein [Cytophagaceae bacterium]